MSASGVGITGRARRSGVVQRMGGLRVATVAELGFVIFTLYHFSGASIFALTQIGAPPTFSDDGSTRLHLINLSIYFLSFVLALTRPAALWRACSADGALVLLLALTFLSGSWSAAPDVTLRRATALVGTAMFGVYFHLRFTREQQLRLLAWALGIGLVLSLPAVALTTGAGEGLVRGVFENKNSLGRMMALAALVYLFRGWSGRGRLGNGLLIGLSLLLVVLARSATALVVVLTVTSMIPLLRTLARDLRPMIVVACLALLLVGTLLLVAASSAEVLTGILGRDVTLTGRTVLWSAVIGMIWERPLLGYGYENFWLDVLPFRTTVDQAAWTSPNAHNGFLEVSLDLGMLGLGVFVFMLARGARRALQALRLDPGVLSLWPLVYLCFLTLYNMTESTALARLNICWVLLVSTLLAVSPGASDELKSRRRADLRPGARTERGEGEAGPRPARPGPLR